jgi:tRNA-2-methylthio-N6-dimethylallyladenosine synthase
MAKKFYIETYGCQMNELDSEKIAGSLRHQGMEPASESSKADVLILNTCSIREKAVQKVYTRLGEIGKYQRDNKELLVGVVGCMAQLEGERILQKARAVKFIAGPQKSQAMPALIELAAKSKEPAIDLRRDDDPEPLETGHILRESSWRAGVTISEGCNRRCSFCVVPATRGRERNRESESIAREVENLVCQGYLEVVLLGQTVNSYQDPSSKEITFAPLLRRLAQIEGLKRIRFTSPHPSDFSEDLLDLIVTYPQICNHIHLPVQSGSSRILRLMKRGYTRKGFLNVIEKIKSASRPIAISTDIIVGFPGESAEDFTDTLSLMAEVQFDGIFSFKYSPRPNTTALSLPDEVAEEEKGRRLTMLQEQQKLIQYNVNSTYIDQALEILVEGRARNRYALCGRTTNNKIVNFDGPETLIGQCIPVKITGFSTNSLKGIWIH